MPYRPTPPYYILPVLSIQPMHPNGLQCTRKHVEMPSRASYQSTNPPAHPSLETQNKRLEHIRHICSATIKPAHHLVNSPISKDMIWKHLIRNIAELFLINGMQVLLSLPTNCVSYAVHDGAFLFWCQSNETASNIAECDTHATSFPYKCNAENYIHIIGWPPRARTSAWM